MHDLIVDREPDRVVIEICSIAGWVCDLVRSLGIEMQVASTNDERWQWRKVKTKNDRRDGLKLAQLSARNELDLYGSGLRIMEAVRLRVKDLDFNRRENTVRDGKGE